LGARGRIFISYRRGDVPGDARGVCDRLERRFGKANVFMDVDRLLAGQRFDRELDKALSQCDVLIAVIGPRWMEILSKHVHSGERDFVHDEIAAALKRDIVVIPALIGQEGHMPSLPQRNDLPEDIRDLVLYQKHDIAHESFNRDADHLTAAIVSVLRGGRRVVPRRAIAISGAIGLTLIATLLGYWMDMIPGIGPSAVQLRPIPYPVTVIPQLNSDANREAKAADEAAKKKAAEEDTSRQAAEAAKRQADADAARKKAEEEATRKKAAEEDASRQAAEAAKRQADADAAKKKVEEEAAKKKAADEEAIRKAAEEARRQADANAVKKKAEEEAANRKAGTDCDRLAASPVDAARQSGVTGVDLGKIDTEAASTACNAAMLGYPAVARFAYQVGRVADAKNDYTRAIALYGVAAGKGHVAAMTELGSLYLVGRPGVQQNGTEARKWFEKAAALGDARAMFDLGLLYEYGNEVTQDYTEARKWYEKAAALGDAEAMNLIGGLYDDLSGWDLLLGRKRLKYRLDYDEAGKWYMKAAALGNATAMFKLGNLYEEGHGVTKDAKQARQWYQKAADAGNGSAKERLKKSK
jgi:TPR repeat protein